MAWQRELSIACTGFLVLFDSSGIGLPLLCNDIATLAAVEGLIQISTPSVRPCQSAMYIANGQVWPMNKKPQRLPSEIQGARPDTGSNTASGKDKATRGNPGSWYSRFSQWFARTSGRPVSFVISLSLTLAWAFLGPAFRFSDTWQLAMNTVSSIATFLMVFVIQNTQNRQTDALQIKLDELIRTTQGAHNALLDLEELDDEQLNHFRQHYVALAQQARQALRVKRELADKQDQ